MADVVDGVNTTGSGPKGTKAVDRALAVLSEFRNGPQLGISELAERLDLSPSTVHRLAQALVARGYLAQDGRTERYRLGLQNLHLGRVVEEALQLQSIRPALESLSGRTQESVNLVHRYTDPAQGIIVDRVESPLPLRFSVSPGDTVPIHCSAGGKALLAFAADPSREVAGIGQLPSFTHRTITDPQQLIAELLRIKERGYSVDDEEFVTGARCVGGPILNRHGIAIAAVAVQAPLSRLPIDRIEEIVPLINETASQIQAVLSGTPGAGEAEHRTPAAASEH